MAVIEINPAKIKAAPRFRTFRMKFNWPAQQALGFLCSFWGSVIDINETGEISDWTPEFLVETVGVELDARRLWEAIVECRYIEERDGRVFILDWIEIAGCYLDKKYHSSDRQRCVNIWALHGQIYRPRSKPKPPEGGLSEAENPGPDDGGNEGENLQATLRPPKGDLKAEGENLQKNAESGPASLTSPPFPYPPPLLRT